MRCNRHVQVHLLVMRWSFVRMLGLVVPLMLEMLVLVQVQVPVEVHETRGKAVHLLQQSACKSHGLLGRLWHGVGRWRSCGT